MGLTRRLNLKSMSQRAFNFSRRARAALERRYEQGDFIGYLEGLSPEGLIRGWVINRSTKRGRLPVRLYVGEELVETGYAADIREDVRDVTDGETRCGFGFSLSELIWDKIAKADGAVSVRVCEGDGTERVLGRLTLAVDHSDPDMGKSDARLAYLAVRDEFGLLLKALEGVPEPSVNAVPTIRPVLARHERLFTKDTLIPDVVPSGHPAHLDYDRYRMRMDENYPVEPCMDTGDQFLFWYISSYRTGAKMRVPLSADHIAHLNEPVLMAGQPFTLSRAIWWRLAGRSDLMGTLNLNDRMSYVRTLFWWANSDALHLGYEDCLVPERFAELLRGVDISRRLDAYPLSYFSELYFLETPRLSFLRPGTPEGRKGLNLAMMVAALRRPDLLRYLPRADLERLMRVDEAGTSAFEQYLNDLNDKADDPEPETETKEPLPERAITMSRARYGAILRKVGFDLDSYSFMSMDHNGHRYDAAALPAPDATQPKVDVQIIGPLEKASGLGQAARLSAAILRQTGLSMRAVDFNMDNPSPEGFSTASESSESGPARVNLIHLNGESVPLAFAHQPDVFSGAYNIGYFFWELDRPALCHYLGMELLDEIWVSTEFGVEIYSSDFKRGPVSNVGMAYEGIDVDRVLARSYVEQRFRFDASHHVVLVAFDSFSFVQRKNPIMALQAFQKAFEGVRNARLIIKTQNRESVFDPVQIRIWEKVDAILAQDRRIVIMNETLIYGDLLKLKAGSDCYLSLHRSEGWGFGMIEAMALGVPVVCTGYSGNMAFCNDNTAWLVDYTLVPLKPGDYIFLRDEAVWANPNLEHAASQLRAVYDDNDARVAKAKAAKDHIRRDFSTKAIAKRYGKRLRKILTGL